MKRTHIFLALIVVLVLLFGACATVKEKAAPTEEPVAEAAEEKPAEEEPTEAEAPAEEVPVEEAVAEEAPAEEEPLVVFRSTGVQVFEGDKQVQPPKNYVSQAVMVTVYEDYVVLEVPDVQFSFMANYELTEEYLTVDPVLEGMAIPDWLTDAVDYLGVTELPEKYYFTGDAEAGVLEAEALGYSLVSTWESVE